MRNKDDIFNKNYNWKNIIRLNLEYFDMPHNTIVLFSRNQFTWDQILTPQPMYIRNRKSSNTCTSDDIPSHYGQVIKKSLLSGLTWKKKSNVSKNVFSNIVMLMWKLFEYSQVPIKRVGPNKRVGWLFWGNFIKEL